MAPVPASKINLPGGSPISEKQFGKNKTWRGFYVGYIGALVALIFQKHFFTTGFGEVYSLLDYQNINIFFYALLFGLGALGGDLIKSYIKRKLGKAPGTMWFPFDQIDLIIGTFIITSPFILLSGGHMLSALLISPFLHFLVNIIAYTIGRKKVWR